MIQLDWYSYQNVYKVGNNYPNFKYDNSKLKVIAFIIWIGIVVKWGFGYQ